VVPVARSMRSVLGIVLITAAMAVSTHFAFQLERAGALSFWLLASVPSLALAAGALVLARLLNDGGAGDWVRPVWGDFTRGVLGAAIVFAAAYEVSHLFAGTPRESWLARFYLQLGDPGTLREGMAIYAVGVPIAAAGEEILWRGLVTRLLVDVVGERWAWAAAAVPYALAQAPTMWALRDPDAGKNPLLVLLALGSGLVWGALAKRFGGRVVPGILAHAMFNWLVLFPFRLWGPGI
jgi:membrane protease YdiL (CAAX protease family)